MRSARSCTTQPTFFPSSNFRRTSHGILLLSLRHPCVELQRGLHRYSRFCFWNRFQNGQLPYPTRNYALRFLLTREGPYLVPTHCRNMTYGLSFESCWTNHRLLHDQVTWCIYLFTL